jgi:hypothetical protein
MRPDTHVGATVGATKAFAFPSTSNLDFKPRPDASCGRDEGARDHLDLELHFGAHVGATKALATMRLDARVGATKAIASRPTSNSTSVPTWATKAIAISRNGGLASGAPPGIRPTDKRS